MGDSAASAHRQGSHATSLRHIVTRRAPGIDVRHACNPPADRSGIKISVEDTARARELELQADAFANLEAGRAEALDKLVGAQADEAAARADLWSGRRHWGRRGLGRGRAGGDQQGGEGGKAAHKATIAILAACASRG